MKTITLLDNDSLSLYVYPEHGIVHHEIHKFVFGETWREMMMKGADAFIEHGCTKWLSNDKSNSAMRQEDLEWGQKNWEGRILEKGWKYWALMMPEKAIGKMNMRPIVDRYAGMGVTVQIFSEFDDAFKWLTQQS
ncbi:hypothetical protein [Marispirochaeta aestuarii]|uniref:hypothetical protein n=1 Tax=Marispirochaeta aestuarii TaxID=1963862 RepID=UPI0029C866B7|nr:hypothetical protein [Marispirochaeta aestuarii]